MACRCNDISNCTKDISKINEIISLISSCDSSNENIKDHLSNLATQCESDFYCNDMTTLEYKEKILNDPLIDDISDISDFCAEELEKLQEEFENMKSEDEEFHKNENKGGE